MIPDIISKIKSEVAEEMKEKSSMFMKKKEKVEVKVP
jgi:hypothetical protein